MFDPQRLLGQMLGGGLGGALGGDHRRRKKKGYGGGFMGGNTAAKAQLGVGLLGIAIAAYEHYSQNKSPTATASGHAPPQPPGSLPSHGHNQPQQYGQPFPQASTPPPPPPSRAAVSMPPPLPTTAQPEIPNADVVVLIQAMVAAAAADGRIDLDERANILEKASQAGMDEDDLKFLESELAKPRTADEIAASARPDIAQDIYAASVLAIDVDTESEHAYLARLGERLGLSAERRAEIHQQIESL